MTLISNYSEGKTPDFSNTQIAFAAKNRKELYKTYLLFGIMNHQSLVWIGTKLLQFAFKIKLPISFLVKKTIFEQFCGGESIESCQKTIDNLAKYHIGTILDYSVEGAQTDEGFEQVVSQIIATIEKAAQHRDKIPFSVFKISGIAPISLLEKIQQKHVLSPKEKDDFEKLNNRLSNICQKASALEVRIFIDAEESWLQDTIDQLASDMMRRYNKQTPIVYNTYQLYLKHKLEQLKADIQTAKKEGYHLGIKLVRGAYMEKERAKALAENYQDPIQPNKKACDDAYNQALELCMEHLPHIGLCAGTHNEKSTLHLIKLIQNQQVTSNNQRIFFAQLLGMSDHISYNLAQAGYNVAKYVPYGEVEKVMPYLFRRAQENTAIAGQSSREFLLVSNEVQRRQKNKTS